MSRGSGVVAVAVAARAFNVSLGTDGTMSMPLDDNGATFLKLGIPRGSRLGLPISPEHAVEVLWSRTGVRVAEVPVLIGSPVAQLPPQSARWRLELEEAVAALNPAGAQIITDVLYVSARPDRDDKGEWRIHVHLEIAAAIQPEQDTITYAVRDEGASELREVTEVWDFAAGAVTRFEPVSLP